MSERPLKRVEKVCSAGRSVYVIYVLMLKVLWVEILGLGFWVKFCALPMSDTTLRTISNFQST